MKRHMCVDIQDLLNISTKKGSLKNTVQDKDGKYLSDADARKYLQYCLDKGWRVLPACDCDNFDYQTGCKGHYHEEV